MEKNLPSALSNTKLRACKICSSIKSQHAFKKDGCPNCTSISDSYNCTSQKFKGMIFLVQPEKSWVAKWQRIDKYVPGTYAMTVEGDLEDEYVCEAEKDGNVYYDRNESFKLE